MLSIDDLLSCCLVADSVRFSHQVGKRRMAKPLKTGIVAKKPQNADEVNYHILPFLEPLLHCFPFALPTAYLYHSKYLHTISSKKKKKILLYDSKGAFKYQLTLQRPILGPPPP